MLKPHSREKSEKSPMATDELNRGFILLAGKPGQHTLFLKVGADQIFLDALSQTIEVGEVLSAKYGKFVIERNPNFDENELVEALTKLVDELIARQTASADKL